MDLAPLYGWLKNGPQGKQKFHGWMVLAHQPKEGPATPVVLMTLDDFNALQARAGLAPGPDVALP